VLKLTVAVQATLIHLVARRGDDRGQTTAEYALVLIGAAAIALMLAAWAAKTDKVGRLFNAVIDHIASQVS
jgi:hypothetical protein